MLTTTIMIVAPFGLEFAGNSLKTQPEHRYKFNGIERNTDFGLNLDFAAFRTYDPAIGRWLQIDPLGELTPSWNPYRHAYNNPIRNSDFLGLTENDEVDRRSRI